MSKPYITTRELPILIIATDKCWNCFSLYCDYGRKCTHDLSSAMTRLSIEMILEGDY